MRREEALRILGEHKPELRRRFGVEVIALFGSTVRDEAGPNSDVDALVEFAPDFEASLLDFIYLKHFLSDEMDAQVDLVHRKTLIPELRVIIREREIVSSCHPLERRVLR